jgi:hypothetical protein
MKRITAINKLLNLEYTNADNVWLTDQQTLRRLIGILGMLLPILLFLFLYIDSRCIIVMPSISHYYYTRACGVLIIIISMLAVFLLIYKGKAPLDFYLSSFAGIGALSLLLFPTDNLINYDHAGQYALSCLRESNFRVTLHYISATIFLGSLASMSLWLFTRSNKPKSKRTANKNIRNIIYWVCGIIMVLAMLVAFIGGKLGKINPTYYISHNITYWMEIIALEFFGISWLVKGEVVLKD